MKFITIGIVMSVIVGGIYLKSLDLGTIETWKPTHATTTVEVHPDWATDEDAVEAAKAVLRRKELEAEKNALEADFEAHKARYESRVEEIDRELGTY